MESLELLKKLVAFESITPDDAGSLAFIKEMFPGFEIIECEKEGVKNLFLHKRFGAGAHLCFAGHLDVVPPGDGWSCAPFVPKERDGYLYGRGTQDMKSGLAAFITAIANLKDGEFSGILSILLTSDEEGEALYGSDYMLGVLEERGLLPDYAIVAEPTCEREFGDAIKVGRRGSINGVLELFGKQGHAAYPNDSINTIDLIAPILANISGRELDRGDAWFAPSKFVITDIRSGLEVTNVTPGYLKMMFNVRNSTKTSKEDVEHFVKTNFEEKDYKLKLTQGSFPFSTKKDSRIIASLSDAIERVCGKAPKRSTAGGTSDARFFAKYGIEVVEFGVKNDRIHAPDERVGVEEVMNLEKVFGELLRNF